MLVDFFPVDWAAGDRPAGEDGEENEFRIRAVGKDPAGRAVVAHIDFYPYFFADLAPGLSESARKLAVMDLVKRHGAVPALSCAVARKSMWGFTDGARAWLAQLAFPSQAAATRARYGLKRARVRTYESGVDPLVRFFHVRGVKPAAWVRFDGAAVEADEPGEPLRVRCDFRRAGPSPLTVRPPLVLASWDIEVYSASGNFPLAANPADRVIQIAVSLERYDTGETRSVVLCLGDTSDVPGVEVVCLADEADLIAEFPRLLREASADVLLSYNGDQFDWKYLHGRASGVLLDDETAEPLVDLAAFGRVPGEPGGELLTKSLVSAAYGDNTFTRLATPGQLNLDLMQYVKREHKLPSVALNAVAREFLGDAKLDLPAAEIFRRFRGGPEDRALIAAYAAKDTQLPLALLRKLAVFENLAEMANAVSVPIEYLLTRGQQIKVWSLVLQTARAKGFVCPDDAGIGLADGEKYVGATVLEAHRGAYFDIVSGLDFASLYPSIIRAYQLCPSTLVLDDRYAAVPGIEYRDIDVGGGVVHRFAVGGESAAGPLDAVVPSLLRDLAEFRTAAKREMAAAKARGDAFAASVANGKQLAYKVSANSVYGFLGASKGFLPCLPVAAATTATGRQMIEQTARMVRELVPGSRVVYGDTDSVMVVLELGPEHRLDMAAHFEAAAAAATAITKTFPAPIELEFEKCYHPYLLFSKKRYSGEQSRLNICCRYQWRERACPGSWCSTSRSCCSTPSSASRSTSSSWSSPHASWAPRPARPRRASTRPSRRARPSSPAGSGSSLPQASRAWAPKSRTTWPEFSSPTPTRRPDVHQARRARLHRHQGHPARAPRQLPARQGRVQRHFGVHHARQGRGRRGRRRAVPRRAAVVRRAPDREVRRVQDAALRVQERQPAARPRRAQDRGAPRLPA